MGALIVIDDGTNPAAAGSTDNPNSFLAAPHVLSNFDDTGVLGWTWSLVDKPTGSSAVLAAVDGALSALTPDLPGSYMVRLETFTNVGKTNADSADEQEIGVRYEVPFDWLLPGAGETIQQDSTAGWKREVNRFLSEVRRNLLPLAGVVNTGAVTATTGRLVLYDPSGGTFTVSAPPSPASGDRWSLKNTTVDVTSVTVDGNGNNIENPSGPALVANFGLGAALASISYLFDGTQWVAV